MRQVYFSSLFGGQKFRLQNDPNSIVFVKREPQYDDDYSFYMSSVPYLVSHFYKDRLVWIN